VIDLHFFPTPNTCKILIFLEETRLEYRLLRVDTTKGHQFEPEFLKIGPNNKIPVIVDHAPSDGGAPLSVFESGAILVYLADKVGAFLRTEARSRTVVMEWIMWQMANQGPSSGENSHFRRAAKIEANGDLSYPIKRFNDQVRRVYGVLDRRLSDRQFVAGDTYTIADMICLPWAVRWEIHGLDSAEFPNVDRWTRELVTRPAVARAMAVGTGS